MTVRDLKDKLADLPDDMNVIVPLNAGDGFDGMFFSPCNEESGEADLGINEDDLDKDEAEILINPPEVEKSFVLVPCGFFSLHDENEIPPELN